MGILFGGWFKEMEEEVNDVFKGDYDAYERHYEKIWLGIANQPPKEYSESFPRVTVGDLICQWDTENNEPKDEFFIQRIVEGKIYGRYIDGRHDNMTEEYSRRQYRKVCSITELI